MKLIVALVSLLITVSQAFTLPSFLEPFVPTKVRAAILDPTEIATLKEFCRDDESTGHSKAISYEWPWHASAAGSAASVPCACPA